MNPEPLPADEIVEPLLRALRSTQALVVAGPPGCGKTTRLSRALLEGGWGAEREIWVAEPWRLAAQLCADFVARQLGERVGQRVGYGVRFEQCVGPETRLRFVTDRVLLERLASAERGAGLGVVVLDDFHQRRAAAELSLMLLRRRLKTDAGLRIVVISDLEETAPVAAYLGDCPQLRCGEPGAAVHIEHEPGDEHQALPLRMSGAIERLACSEPRGDLLAFLPGAEPIEHAAAALRPWAEQQGLELVPLHGELPPELALRALSPARRRKLVLASELAESSLTIPGISAVVDAGLAHRTCFSPWTDRQSWRVQPVSRASAARRAARASVAPARVVRLYTEASWQARPERERPELLRVDLTAPLLTLYACKVPSSPELWLEAPSNEALEDARARLQRLGLASGDRLTELGRRASLLQVPPRLARVALAGAELGIPRRICLAVALLAEREIRLEGANEHRDLGMLGGDCDIEQLIGLYAAAEGEQFAPAAVRQLGLHVGRVETVRRSYEQLLENLVVREPAAREEALDIEATRRALALALLAGFPERIASRQPAAQNQLLLSTGQAAQLAPESVARTSPFLLAVEAEERLMPGARQDSEAGAPVLCVRVASPIEDHWLIEHAPEGLSERELLEWDAQQEAAILITQLCWGEVVLRQSLRPAYPGIVTGALVERAALVQLDTLFAKADGLPDLVARSELVDQQLPELGLERINELGMRGLLSAACKRVISLAQLRELDWGEVFLEQLSAEQRRELERQAPEYVTLKGGRRLRVQYGRGQSPFIAARMQDFFGMVAGPALVSGRVPLTLHLLAPNERAVQVTADLTEFWERHYPGLRRELSRRYPRDAWPEEPRTATAPAPRGSR